MTALQIAWFVIPAVFVAVYAALDGFVLGIGMLYPIMGRGAEQRRQLHHAVGPVWDSNEVWLIMIGGLFFAVFPAVYATVLSGFYLVFMLVFFGLIMRATALGLFYRGAPETKGWLVAFVGGSVLVTFFLGLSAGNLIRGVDLTAGGDIVGGPGSLFSPFALCVGLLALAVFANQGAGWAALKTQGATHASAVKTRWVTGWVLLGLFAAVTFFAAFAAEDHTRTLAERPLGWVVVGLVIVGVVMQQIWGRLGHDLLAFVGTSASVVGLVGIWVVGAYPVIVRAANGEAFDLTVANAVAPHSSLVAMSVVAGVGIPLLALCAALVYRVFRGRGEESGEGY